MTPAVQFRTGTRQAVLNAQEVQTPSTGDVLITRDRGWYAIAIVPERQQIRLADSDHAVRIANAWAKKHGVRVWRLEDSGPVRLDDHSRL